MLIKNISVPTYLEDIEDIENGNIEVFVEFEDDSDYTYIVIVATTKNVEYLMDKEKLPYFEPGYPFIFVKKLTKEIITRAIKAYSDGNPYWLKLHHFAGDIDMAVFNKLKATHINDLKESDELDDF